MLVFVGEAHGGEYSLNDHQSPPEEIPWCNPSETLSSGPILREVLFDVFGMSEAPALERDIQAGALAAWKPYLNPSPPWW